MTPEDKRVAALGRLFFVAMNKRDGLATQEQVDAEVEKVLDAFRRPANG